MVQSSRRQRLPAWYRALGDPVVGRALRVLHEEPARAWTVDTLAAQAAVSRATFARRFTELVGESPRAYLTRWRLSLAADLLQATDLTVEAVARKVGFQSGFGLSVAFKRVHGTRPSDIGPLPNPTGWYIRAWPRWAMCRPGSDCSEPLQN